MRFADVVERHHHHREKHDRRDGADQVGVGPEHAVLVGHGRPAHRLQRTKIGRDEAQAGNPGRHLAARHEEILAGGGVLLEIKPYAEAEGEVDGNDEVINRGQRQQAFVRRLRDREEIQGGHGIPHRCRRTPNASSVGHATRAVSEKA